MNDNDIAWIISNWEKIPDNFKIDLRPSRYSRINKGLERFEEHIVVLLLDRQKPSVVPYYDFDEERIGINRQGKVIWGFDSGCSCPSPWDDSYNGELYEVNKTWKEFEINIKEFDEKVVEECDNKLSEIKKAVNRN